MTGGLGYTWAPAPHVDGDPYWESARSRRRGPFPGDLRPWEGDCDDRSGTTGVSISANSATVVRWSPEPTVRHRVDSSQHPQRVHRRSIPKAMVTANPGAAHWGQAPGCLRTDLDRTAYTA
jgi:hypothetical protein